MYIPSYFQMADCESMYSFIRQHSFGILFAQCGDAPLATHLPLVLDVAGDAPKLTGHFARANEQWKSMDGAEVLVVFQGPHAYISPSWYVEQQAVPTWNYMAVHVAGRCRIVHDAAELHGHLRKMVGFYEPNSTLLNHLDEDFYVKMAQGVVGFEIEVTRMEGKSKMSQNKSPETIEGVVRGLRQTGDVMNEAVADVMEQMLRDPVKRRE